MMKNIDAFTAARDFLYREGRLLEQRLFATLFEQAPATGVLDALRGYQNDDGGFGHGLEPDKRCPQSQPLDVQFALQTMDAAGVTDVAMLQRACAFLASVSDANGAVAPVLPSIASYPRAEHWGDGDFPPGLSPTTDIAGLLLKFGVQHPWLDRAAAYCWAALERELPDDAHTLSDALTFLAFAPDRGRAEALIPRVASRLSGARFFRVDPGDRAYGLSPLHFAPAPSSRWRSLFDDRLTEAHLGRLQADQQADGGWPLSWNPPSQASTLAWRGHETLKALRVLVAYGRIAGPANDDG